MSYRARVTIADDLAVDGLAPIHDDPSFDITQEFHVRCELYRLDPEHALVELTARFGTVRRFRIACSDKFRSDLSRTAEDLSAEDEADAEAYVAGALQLPEGSGCRFERWLNYDSGFCSAAVYYENAPLNGFHFGFAVDKRLRDEERPAVVATAIDELRRSVEDAFPFWERTEFISQGADEARALLDELLGGAEEHGFTVTVSDPRLDDRGVVACLELRRADGKAVDAFPELDDADGAYAELERAMDWFAALDALNDVQKRAEAAGLVFEVIDKGYDNLSHHEPYAIIALTGEDGATSEHQIDPLDEDDDLAYEIEGASRGTRRRSTLLSAIVAPRHERATIEVSGAMGKLVTHVHRVSEGHWHIAAPAVIDAINSAGERSETFFISITAPNGDIVDGIEQYDAYVYMVDEGEPEPVPAEILREIRPNAAAQVHFIDAFDAA